MYTKKRNLKDKYSPRSKKGRQPLDFTQKKNKFSMGALPSSSNFSSQKTYKLPDGKPVIIKSNKNVPSKKTIWNTYKNIPDNRNIPLVFQTKEQYLKEYIKNQEKQNNIDFPKQQEQQYIKTELKDMSGISARYTTKHNEYKPPQTVFFTDTKWTPKTFKQTAQHEVGHEIYERNKNIKQDWKSVNKSNSPTEYGKTDKEEDFADSYMLYKNGQLKDVKRKNIIVNNINNVMYNKDIHKNKKKQYLVKDNTSNNDMMFIETGKEPEIEEVGEHWDKPEWQEKMQGEKGKSFYSDPVRLRTGKDSAIQGSVTVSNLYSKENYITSLQNKDFYNNLERGLKKTQTENKVQPNTPVKTWGGYQIGEVKDIVGDDDSKNRSKRSKLADTASLLRTYSDTYEGDTLGLPYGHSRNINIKVQNLKSNPVNDELREELKEEIEFRKTLKNDPSLTTQEIKNFYIKGDDDSKDDMIYSVRPYREKFAKTIIPTDMQYDYHYDKETGKYVRSKFPAMRGRGSGWYGSGIYGFATKGQAEDYQTEMGTRAGHPGYIREFEIKKPFKPATDHQSDLFHIASKEMFEARTPREISDVQQRFSFAGLEVSEDEIKKAKTYSKRSGEQPINYLLRKKGYDGVIPTTKFQNTSYGSVMHVANPEKISLDTNKQFTEKELEQKREHQKVQRERTLYNKQLQQERFEEGIEKVAKNPTPVKQEGLSQKEIDKLPFAIKEEDRDEVWRDLTPEEQEKAAKMVYSDAYKHYENVKGTFDAMDIKSDVDSNNNWNIKKPVGYPIFDYPNNLGKKRTISFEDPGEMIDIVKGSYNVSTRDEFVKNAERGYGDDSETTIPEFRELIKSKENILPPIGIEHKPNGRVFFEGRHRLAAAYLEGVKVPTVQVYDATEDEKDAWKRKSFQDKKDYYASQLDIEQDVDSNNRRARGYLPSDRAGGTRDQSSPYDYFKWKNKHDKNVEELLPTGFIKPPIHFKRNNPEEEIREDYIREHNLKVKQEQGEDTSMYDADGFKINKKFRKNIEKDNGKNYWNLSKAKKEGRTITYMQPQEYLERTGGVDQHGVPIKFMETYNDRDAPLIKGQENKIHPHFERWPIKKLSQHIQGSTPVDIPWIGTEYDSEHEGRHRAYAAQLAGQSVIPVGTKKKPKKPYTERDCLMIGTDKDYIDSDDKSKNRAKPNRMFRELINEAAPLYFQQEGDYWSPASENPRNPLVDNYYGTVKHHPGIIGELRKRKGVDVLLASGPVRGMNEDAVGTATRDEEGKEIIILRPTKKDEKGTRARTVLHELKHIDQQREDPKEYMKTYELEKNMESPHLSRPSESEAEKYAYIKYGERYAEPTRHAVVRDLGKEATHEITEEEFKDKYPQPQTRKKISKERRDIPRKAFKDWINYIDSDDKSSNSINLKNPLKYKENSEEWDNIMFDNIIEKYKHNEQLGPYEQKYKNQLSKSGIFINKPEPKFKIGDTIKIKNNAVALEDKPESELTLAEKEYLEEQYIRRDDKSKDSQLSLDPKFDNKKSSGMNVKRNEPDEIYIDKLNVDEKNENDMEMLANMIAHEESHNVLRDHAWSTSSGLDNITVLGVRDKKGNIINKKDVALPLGHEVSVERTKRAIDQKWENTPFNRGLIKQSYEKMYNQYDKIKRRTDKYKQEELDDMQTNQIQVDNSRNKKVEYVPLSSREYQLKAKYRDADNPEAYGKTSTISGQTLGRGITASGVVVPVAIPLPLAAGVGGYVSRKVENVKLIKTDEHDKKYKIPRVQVNLKNKDDDWEDDIAQDTSKNKNIEDIKNKLNKDRKTWDDKKLQTCINNGACATANVNIARDLEQQGLKTKVLRGTPKEEGNPEHWITVIDNPDGEDYVVDYVSGQFSGYGINSKVNENEAVHKMSDYKDIYDEYDWEDE